LHPFFDCVQWHYPCQKNKQKNNQKKNKKTKKQKNNKTTKQKTKKVSRGYSHLLPLAPFAPYIIYILNLPNLAKTPASAPKVSCAIGEASLVVLWCSIFSFFSFCCNSSLCL
jgi:hypothetical protein